MSNGNGDDKFAAWLTRNADETPKAGTNEKARIWQAIERDTNDRSKVRTGRWTLSNWMMPVSAIAVLVLSVTIGILSQPGKRGELAPSAVQISDADFDEVIEDSLDLAFMDNGEIVEITALTELSAR